MIEENVIFEKKEIQAYPLLPKGIYQAELLDVKTHENETYNSKMGKTNGVKKYQTDLSWQFTILAGRDENQEKEEMKELRGRNAWENFGKSYFYIEKTGKNNLYRIVEAFLGRELNQEEEAKGIAGQLLNSFVGKQINLSIETKTSKKGKTFDNIIDYFKVNAELTPLTPEEREKATIKKDNQETTTDRGTQFNQPINNEDIDNVGADDDTQEIPLSSIPF